MTILPPGSAVDEQPRGKSSGISSATTRGICASAGCSSGSACDCGAETEADAASVGRADTQLRLWAAVSGMLHWVRCYGGAEANDVDADVDVDVTVDVMVCTVPRQPEDRDKRVGGAHPCTHSRPGS